MKTVFQVRKPCPRCGRAMKLVSAEKGQARPEYVCIDCDDPLRDPLARHWAESPLKPPRDRRSELSLRLRCSDRSP